MKREEIARLKIGQIYEKRLRQSSPGGLIEEITYGHYEITGFPFCGETRTEMVSYRGLDGYDRDVDFVATLSWFAMRFFPVPQPEVAIPDKGPAGSPTTGSGF